MADALMSTFPNGGGTIQESSMGNRFVYFSGGKDISATRGSVALATPLVQGYESGQLVPDKTSAELAIRRLTHEIGQAEAEVKALEAVLLRELLTPPAKEWLLPLMAIGLLFSLFGSVMAVNLAGMGATGLMLLWSLSAFWYVYTGDKRLAMARNASQAEIEIWTNRIQELQLALEKQWHIVEKAN